jgi:hypothetical protein
MVPLTGWSSNPGTYLSAVKMPLSRPGGSLISSSRKSIKGVQQEVIRVEENHASEYGASAA